TITFTFLDGKFRARHRWYAHLALLLPVIVIYLGVNYYTFLVTFFFSWASLHVLHQLIYLTDCYRARSRYTEERWSRYVDYGLILTALYPIGLYKLAIGQFHVGGVVLPYPDLVLRLHLPELVGIVFTIFLLAWIYKTVTEFRSGRGNVPKALLIG